MDLSGHSIPKSAFSADLSGATTIVITVEPDGDTDTIPADTHYLAGNLTNGSATLTVGHMAALGDDFVGATGDFILATPTDGADSNETSGIWYIDLSSGEAMPGLQLPTLPAGFEYEGWVIFGGTPVSTGRFQDVAAADSG